MNTNGKLRDVLIAKFFKGDTAYLSTPKGREDLEWHVSKRSDKFRTLYAKWLAAVLGKAPRRILEVGCGTGSSTEVLAELGHHIDVIDVEQDAIDIALFRCSQGGRGIDHAFAGNLEAFSKNNQLSGYDAMVFWASLEHMTIAERLNDLKLSYAGIRPGSQILVMECPNRLWRFDSHTSLLPFYHWLPDELIISAGLVPKATDAKSLYRIGRGVSFHEFQYAGIPVGRDATISSLQDWGRRSNLLKRLKWLMVSDSFFERGLMRMAPHVHPSFFHEHIDICITKSQS